MKRVRIITILLFFSVFIAACGNLQMGSNVASHNDMPYQSEAVLHSEVNDANKLVGDILSSSKPDFEMGIPVMVNFESVAEIERFLLAVNESSVKYEQFAKDECIHNALTYDMAKIFAENVNSCLLPYIKDGISFEEFGATYFAERNQLDAIFIVNGIRYRFIYDLDISEDVGENLYDGIPVLTTTINGLGTLTLYQRETIFVGSVIRNKMLIRVFVYAPQSNMIDFSVFEYLFV